MPERAARRVFCIGGARSGKSRFALSEASKIPGSRAFIATATPSDDEMVRRIRKHQEDRSGDWETFEEPLDAAVLLARIGTQRDVVVLDCLTLWLSNMMFSGRDIESECRALVSSIRSYPSSLFVVANEVGLGIVPDNAIARDFRDLAGFLNQGVAEASDEVYLMTAGIPLRIK